MTRWNKIIQYGMALARRRTFAAVAIIVACGAVGAADAFSGSARGVWGRGRYSADSIDRVRQALQRGSPWLDLLKVTAQQRIELRHIVDRHETALRQLESARNRVTEEFSSAFVADVLNPTDIERARAEAGALGEQAIDESVVAMTEAGQILTSEQRRQVVRLWRDR